MSLRVYCLMPILRGCTVRLRTVRKRSIAYIISEFDPGLLFRHTYRKHCLSTFKTVFDSAKLAEELCTCIEDHMSLLFTSVDQGFETSAQVHVSNLRSHPAHWSQLKSHATCLFCLRRRPEHVLTCEHAICDICLIVFGDAVIGKEAHFELRSCILCETGGSVVARLKPSTAGARILTDDGGGIRGVVPLEFLRLLQGLLGPDLPVQDLFEQAFGTSSGKHSKFDIMGRILRVIRWSHSSRTFCQSLGYRRLLVNLRYSCSRLFWYTSNKGSWCTHALA